jgi:hypothetical protein
MTHYLCRLVLLIFCVILLPRLGWAGQRNLQSEGQQNPQSNPEPGAEANSTTQNPQNQDSQQPANPGQQPQNETPPKSEGGTSPTQSPPGKTKQATMDAAQTTKQVAKTTLGWVRDWETQWLVGAYVSRNRTLSPLTAKQREEIYLQQTWLTPGAYMKRMFDAGVDQTRGVPRQWDDGWGGYAERWASREGQFIAANSLAALGDAKIGYEPRYDQCRCSGFLPRTRHAILRNFITYNRSERKERPQWALYAGAFVGGMIATSWKPKPLNPFAQGGWGMAGQAGYGTLLNFFTEFAVDINRKLGARKLPPESQ